MTAEVAFSRGVREGPSEAVKSEWACTSHLRTRVTATKPAFPECHLPIRHCANSFVCINSFKPYILPFTVKEIELQRISEICPKSHNQEMAKMGLCLCISLLELL